MKKNFPDDRAKAPGADQYRSITTIPTSSKHMDPVYRSLATIPLPKESTTSSAPPMAALLRQGKDAKHDHRPEIDVKEVAKTASLEGGFSIRDLSSTYPLAAQSHFAMRTDSVESFVELLQKSVSVSEVKPHKGVVRLTASKVQIKVCFWKTSQDKAVVEFNRLQGCAVHFQREYLRALLLACNFVDSLDKSIIQQQLKSIEGRLNFFANASQVC